MPALWVLNGRIPRTMQYGACSCWDSGCGEVDIYEVLAPGDDKCKSTVHVNGGAGSSDYFERPSEGFTTVAVVFDKASAGVSIKRLKGGIEFGEGFSGEVVKGWMADGG